LGTLWFYVLSYHYVKMIAKNETQKLHLHMSRHELPKILHALNYNVIIVMYILTFHIWGKIDDLFILLAFKMVKKDERFW
jgi:hypothetical protein